MNPRTSYLDYFLSREAPYGLLGMSPNSKSFSLGRYRTMYPPNKNNELRPKNLVCTRYLFCRDTSLRATKSQTNANIRNSPNWLGWRDSNPRDTGVKVLCLTAWRHPSIKMASYLAKLAGLALLTRRLTFLPYRFTATLYYHSYLRR